MYPWSSMTTRSPAQRIPRALLDRAEALRPALHAADPLVGTRQAVLIRALQIGLDTLEGKNSPVAPQTGVGAAHTRPHPETGNSAALAPSGAHVLMSRAGCGGDGGPPEATVVAISTRTAHRDGVPLPCPFCGDPDGAMSPPNLTAQRWVFCPGCGAEGPPSVTVEMAIGAWNDREPLTAKGGAR